MDINPEDVWKQREGIIGVGYPTHESLPCSLFCLQDAQKKLADREQQFKDLNREVEGLRPKLRALNQQISALKLQGLTDRDRPVLRLASQIDGIETSIRCSENSVTLTLRSQIAFYQKLLSECQSRVNRLQALKKVGDKP